MNRSTNRVFLFCLMTLLLTTCRQDEWEDNSSQGYDPKVAAAKQWFESHSSSLSIKREDGTSIQELTPDWKTARKKSNKWIETVEVEMKMGNRVGFSFPESKEKYEETGDWRYLLSTTRLVIRTQKRTKKTDGFLMTVLPSPSYLERINFGTPIKVAYIGRDKFFSGRIIYHSLYGMFVNGWVYKDGKITNRFGSNGNSTGNSGASIRRLSQECITYIYCVYKMFCWQAGSYYTCTGWELDYCYEITECVTVNDNNSGNGFPNGGMEYFDVYENVEYGDNPPPDNTPCDKLNNKDQGFRDKLTDLKAKTTSMTVETAYFLTPDGSYTTFVGKEPGYVNIDTSNPINEVYHNHNTDLLPIYSIQDLTGLYDLYTGGKMANKKDFNFVLVTPGATYNLKITDEYAFLTNFVYKYLKALPQGTEKEGGMIEAQNKLNVNEGTPTSTAEKRFLKFIADKGLTLYKSRDNSYTDWGQVQKQGNNINIVNCN